jgi:hypothetical protein
VGSSIAIGIVGILATGGVLIYWGSRENQAAEYGWYLGLASLGPAWLVVLLGLVGRVTLDGTDVPLPPSVILSSAAVLLGIILTDALNRRLPGWGFNRSSKVSYVLGVIALVPGWIIALWAIG